MGRSSKRKTAASSKAEMVREKLIGRVASELHRVQQHWAAFMHRQLEHLSRKGKLLMLACFTLLGSAYCGFLICKGLLYKETGSAKLPEIQSIVRIDQHITATIPKEKILRVLQFKEHLDSLARSPKGRQ